MHAATDGTIIWLHNSLLAREERCALTHEIDHIEEGHTGRQPQKVERRIREKTARRLIPVAWLVDAYRWSPQTREVAEELGVTEAVLLDRLDTLNQRERLAFREIMEYGTETQVAG